MLLPIAVHDGTDLVLSQTFSEKSVKICEPFGLAKVMGDQAFVVLGGGGSIGSAVVRRLCSSGAKIIVGARNVAQAKESLAGCDCIFAEVQAENSSSIESAVQLALTEFGSVTGVVNCIGSVLLKPAHLTTDDEWAQTITTNLTSSFSLVRAAAKAMRQSGGSIVLVSSAAAQIGLANHEAIAAAKAGIIGLTLSSAATYASRNIRVNAVAPGLVKSTMTKKLWETADAASMSSQMHALGRLGEPDEVASAIEWLLSPSNGWVTGQVLAIDGGLSSVLTRMKM